MRVFVTGATGWIGEPTVKELIKAGHQVLGLTRSDKGAEKLKALGAEAHRGTLEDIESLKQGAAASEGVIHLAFDHNFSDYEGICAKDRAAIEAMGSVLEGTNRPLIIAAGTLSIDLPRTATEDDKPDLSVPGPMALRGRSEELALSLASKGVRSAVVRLPPTNHGTNDPGFITMLVSTAREKGVSFYIGDGLNRWPATHHFDSARAFALAVEKATPGSVFNAVAEEGVALKDIATAIGEELKVPVVSKTMEEAMEQFGFVGMVVARNNPTSSAKTREVLGWEPAEVPLITDIKKNYFSK